MSETQTQAMQLERQKGDLGYMAHYYDLVMVLLTLGREKKLRQMTLDLAQVKTGDKVLEIGCGTGTLSIAAKRRVGSSGEVMGIDIAPEMLAVARRKAVRENVEVSFQDGSIDKIPFPDNRFDTVMCSFMIFHMPEDVRRKGLAEAFRVLKPGGHLFVIDTVDLSGLEPLLRVNSFDEISLDAFKLNFMSVRFLRGMARKP